jgi:hypothetical protein
MVVVSIAKFGVRRAKQNFAHLGVGFAPSDAVARARHEASMESLLQWIQKGPRGFDPRGPF